MAASTHSWDISTHVTEYCAVIGPALCSQAQQTAVKEVTRPLTSLAKWGVARFYRDLNYRNYVHMTMGD